MNTMETDDPFADLEVVEEEALEKINPTRMISPKQHDFIMKLLEERDHPESDELSRAVPYLTMREATRTIDELLAKPKKPTHEAPEGLHILPDGEIYKVQVAHHGSGNKYAKRLVILQGQDQPTGTFEYEGRKPLAKLSEDTLMTLEQAQQFGKL